MIHRADALRGSPPLRTLLFVLVVDRITDATLTACELVHRLRQKART